MPEQSGTRESCECDECRKACETKPGWFKFGEVEKVAEYLGISLEELFRTDLAIDWWEESSPTFLIAPGTLDSQPGTEYPLDPSGICRFYENGRCRIHPVRPYECRTYLHSDKSELVYERHRAAKETWGVPEAREQVAKLLGREPRHPSANLGDVLDILFKRFTS